MTENHPDVPTIRANRLEIARMLVAEDARVERAKRKARAEGKRSNAGVQAGRICRRFGLSESGYAPMDIIASSFIMGGITLGGPAKDPMQVALAAIDAACKEAP